MFIYIILYVYSVYLVCLLEKKKKKKIYESVYKIEETLRKERVSVPPRVRVPLFILYVCPYITSIHILFICSICFVHIYDVFIIILFTLKRGSSRKRDKSREKRRKMRCDGKEPST